MTNPSHPAPARHGLSSVELFFDLVFVFAVSQLSHHLLQHTDPRGAGETLVMLVAVFGVWSYTSFEVTLTHSRRTQIAPMMLGVMALGLFMNTAIAHAFAEAPFAFVVPLLLIQIGRTVLSTIPNAPAVLRRHYTVMLGWIVATAPLWLAGAFARPEARLLWWGAAAALDTVGTWMAHPLPGRRLKSEHIAFDAEHMIERLRLFLIIALGEVVLTTGAAMAATPPSAQAWLPGACGLVLVIALWSLYFGASDSLVTRHASETRNPIRAARLAMNGQIVVVGGLIAIAVANEKVVAHPQGHADAAVVGLLLGGMVAYLVVQTWYLKIATGRLSPARTAGTVALLFAAALLTFVQAAPLTVIATAAVLGSGLAVGIAARVGFQNRPVDLR